jgi:hypothetical protein
MLQYNKERKNKKHIQTLVIKSHGLARLYSSHVIQNNPPKYRNVLWFLKHHFYLGEEVDV